MTSLDHLSHNPENMPGYHYARIVAYSLTLPPAERRKVHDSARLLLDRGDAA